MNDDEIFPFANGEFSDSNITDFSKIQSINSYSSLNLSKNPIKYLTSLPTTPSLETLIMDETKLKSLKGAKPQPQLEIFSCKQTPFSTNENAALMSFIIFGDNLKEFNNDKIKENVQKRGKFLRIRIRNLLEDGWKIASDDPLVLKKKRRVVELTDENLEKEETVDISAFIKSKKKERKRAKKKAKEEEKTPKSILWSDRHPNEGTSDSSCTLMDSIIFTSSDDNTTKFEENDTTKSDTIADDMSQPKRKDSTAKKKRRPRRNTAPRKKMSDIFDVNVPAPVPKYKPPPLLPIANDINKYNVTDHSKMASDSECSLLKNKIMACSSPNMTQLTSPKKFFAVDSDSSSALNEKQGKNEIPLKNFNVDSSSGVDESNKKLDDKEQNLEEDKESNSEKKFAVESDSSSKNKQEDKESDLEKKVDENETNAKGEQEKTSIAESDSSVGKKKKERKKSKRRTREGRKASRRRKSKESSLPIIPKDFTPKSSPNNEKDEDSLSSLSSEKEQVNSSALNLSSSDKEEKENPAQTRTRHLVKAPPLPLVNAFANFNVKEDKSDVDLKPRKKLRKKKAIPQVAVTEDEGCTEIFETDDGDSGADSDPPVFKKVNFFKLIGIEPDSDDEFLSQDDTSNPLSDIDFDKEFGSDKSDVQVTQEELEEIRAKGRQKFYQIRTVETSTLEEMEKFVSSYVKAVLESRK